MNDTSLHIIHSSQKIFEERFINLMAEGVVEKVLKEEELRVEGNEEL